MIDTHAHLNFNDFQDDYAEVIKRSFDNGIKAIINVGSNFLTSQRAVEIAKEFLNCYAAIGLHPIHIQDEEFKIEDYRQLIRANKRIVKAIGETGLDYFHDRKNQEKQKEIFLKHLELAKEFNLTIILHCRGEKNNPKQAYEDLLSIINNQLSIITSGVIHCFSADWQVAQKFLDLDFYLGFTGIITFPNVSQELVEVVDKVPREKILIETDCPFLAPQPVRGQRCEPWHVKFTAEKIAEIKKIPFEEIIKETTNNAIKLFNLGQKRTDLSKPA
ncbi:MAG: TatD family hydrolase [Patescibacteria group bacterium]